MASSVSNAGTGSTPAGPSKSSSLSGFKKTLAAAKLGGKNSDDLKSSTFEQLLQIPIEFKSLKRASDELWVNKPESKPSKPEKEEDQNDDKKSDEPSNQAAVDPSLMLNLKCGTKDNQNPLEQKPDSPVELTPIDATAKKDPNQELVGASQVVEDAAAVSDLPKAIDSEVTQEQPIDSGALLAASDDETRVDNRSEVVDSKLQQAGTESAGQIKEISDHLSKDSHKDGFGPGKDKLSGPEVQPTHLEQTNGDGDAPRSGRRSRKERLEEEAANPSPNYFGSKKDDIAAEKPTPVAPAVDASQSLQPSANQASNPPTVNPENAVQAQAAVNAASNLASTSAGASTTSETKPVSSVTGSTAVGGSSIQTARNESAEKTKEKPAVEQRQQLRLIQRVAKGFERIGQDGGQVRLRLHPPELGSLTVTVKVEGTQVSAKMSAETTEARDIILNNLPLLKQQLADAGLTIQNFDVDVSGQGLANSGGNQGQPENMFGSSGGSGGRSSDGRMPASNRVVTGARSSSGPVMSSYSQGRSIDLQV